MLVHVRRREIAARIQEAKELGDLSENAEYAEAKNEQAFNEGRIEELESTLKHAVVIDEQANSTGFVQVGSVVEASANGQTMKLSIVGSNEADPLTGRISNESPLGQALLGQAVGAAVKVLTPKGEILYTIQSIA
jgi:transcription elongation factor GreA